MTVLFGQSYYLRFDPKLWRAGQPYPPLGTLFAAARVRAAGHAVSVFDAMLAESEAEWERALDRVRPQAAVLYEDNFNYLSKMCLARMREAAGRMLGAARRRGIPALACGADASDDPAHYLESGADYVLTGEGEETLVELLGQLAGAASCIEQGGAVSHPPEAPPSLRRSESGSATSFDPGRVLGLAYRDSQGALVRTPPRPVLRDLDAAPPPAWELADLERYRATWRRRHGRFSVNMVTTRGCPYHCNWCAKPIWGQSYHSRGPAHVADELRVLREAHGAEHVWFADDIFGLKPGWTAAFAEELERRGLRTPFKCQSRADLVLRPGEIAALARAGCESVWIGAESGSQKVLDAMEKGTTVEQIRAAAAGLRAAGMRVGFFLQFGYPGEGPAEIEATLELVRTCAPDEIGISVSYPLPGTKFHERVRHALGEKRNWVDSEDLDPLYRGPAGAAFYRQLHLVAQKSFRRDHARRELLSTWSRPGGLRPGHARRLLALAWHSLSLPFERRRLALRARAHEAPLLALPPGLGPEQAARPTPQA